MPKAAVPFDHRKLLRTALWRTLLLPVLVLIFFITAPNWYNSKLHTTFREQITARSQLSETEKGRRIAFFDKLDFQNVVFDCPVGLEHLREGFEKEGICGTFERLWWGLIFSIILVVMLGASMLAMLSLNLDAKKSLRDLIRNYRLGWKIAMATAIIKLALLIPLLAYGCYEFTVLLSGMFLPKLLLLIVVGGLFGLWTSARVLLRKVPLEVLEPMSREITADDAPELWEAVRTAADSVQTAAPDRIVVGLKLNFFVTELAVKTDTGRVTGRTLFLSYPLLKQLSTDEVVAIIGHELGHFKGNDTRITREFYPLRLKVNGTIFALARSGPAGWPSVGLLSFFSLTFEKTVQGISRIRELAADKIGAALTAPETMARALVRLHVLVEAVQRMASDPVASREQHLMDIGWHKFIEEKILPDDPFWLQLAEKKLSHPLDTHPPLQDRLNSLGGNVALTEAREIALQQTHSAYAGWFANRDALFVELAKQADAAMGKLQTRTQLTSADYGTDAGKELLDRHFPEKRWQKQQTGIRIFVGVFGVLFLICLATFILVPLLGARLVIGALTLLIALIGGVVWVGRNDELILNAQEVFHPAWIRPLRFEEVASMELKRINSSLMLKFKLKTRQKTIAKWSLPLSINAVLLNLSGGLNEKPLVIAQTIHRYFTRTPE